MSFKTVLLQEKNSFKVCAFQHIPDVFAITLFSSTFFNNRQFSNAPFIQQERRWQAKYSILGGHLVVLLKKFFY